MSTIDLKINQSTPVGRLLWPSLIEPTVDLSGNTCWACGVELHVDQSEHLFAIVEAALDNARKVNSQFPRGMTFKDSRGREDVVNVPYRTAMEKVNGEKKEKPDYLVWSFKRKTKTKKGEPASPPVILSPKGALVSNPPAITHGSMARIWFRVFDYDNASKGIGFYLLGAQVASLAQGGLDDVDAIDGDWDPDADVPTPAAVVPAVPANAIPVNFDDEVPF